MPSSKELNQRSTDYFPGLLGIVITNANGAEITAQLSINRNHMAPNGYIHAGCVVTLADTCAGYGCMENLPEGAAGFTTIELKSNHLGTARDGQIECKAMVKHMGRTTQVWDAEVTHIQSGKVIAIFRCTQLLLYDKAR